MDLVIVDDHDIFRQSLVLLLDQQPNLTVLGHFSALASMLAADLPSHPTCVLLDYHLPDENPVATLSELRNRWPQAAFVFLTGTRSSAILRRILASQVDAVLHKSDDAQTLIDALQRLGSSTPLLSSSIEQALAVTDYGLTAKEFDVLAFLTKGYTPAQISDQLFLSKRTVEKHKENIMRKTGVHNLAQLMELGHRLVLAE